jgi:hypothetical protein
MPEPPLAPQERLAALSGSARRLLDYVAVLPGGARYAALRHLARATEEDMVEDLRELVDAGLLAPVPGRLNVYDFPDAAIRDAVLASIGAERLPKLQRRAQAALRRVSEGPPS